MKRVFIGIAAVVALVAGFCIYQLNNRPSLAAYSELWLAGGERPAGAL